MDRDALYAEACSAIAAALCEAGSAVDARTREREAIWGVLERHGLLVRWRGSRRVPRPPGHQQRTTISARVAT